MTPHGEFVANSRWYAACCRVSCCLLARVCFASLHSRVAAMSVLQHVHGSERELRPDCALAESLHQVRAVGCRCASLGLATTAAASSAVVPLLLSRLCSVVACALR